MTKETRKEENNQERGPLFVYLWGANLYISRRNSQNEGDPKNKELQTDFQRLPFPKGSRDQIVMISTEKQKTCSQTLTIQKVQYTHLYLLSCKLLEGRDSVFFISLFPECLTHAEHLRNWIYTLLGRDTDLHFQVGTQGRVQVALAL